MREKEIIIIELTIKISNFKSETTNPSYQTSTVFNLRYNSSYECNRQIEYAVSMIGM